MNKVHQKKPATVVPAKYAGKWVAWSEDRTHVVTSGRTIKEVSQKVKKHGYRNVWFGKIPDANVRFGGAAFHV